LLLRRALTRLGLRYRLHAPELPGHPDIVFRRCRVAVFCDGDYWHGRDLEYRLSKLRAGNNPDYWVAKISRNVQRDLETNEALKAAGWVVLRFWESDIRKDADTLASIVESALARPIRRHRL
jgi:DNA mismatch endonuclease (patch repair protein)